MTFVSGFGFGMFQAVDTALMSQVLPSAKSFAKDLGVVNIAATLPEALVTPPVTGVGRPHVRLIGLFPIGMVLTPIGGRLSPSYQIDASRDLPPGDEIAMGHHGRPGPPPPTEGTPLQRADALLQQMTLDEKALQLSATMPIGLLGVDGLIESQATKVLGNGIGQVSAHRAVRPQVARHDAHAVNRVQRFLVERTRLGIPAIFHNEALNGVLAPDFTVFPTAIGLAATWDPMRSRRWRT